MVMDESMVDIILILLAGLVAVSTMPQFAVEPPDSVEVTEGARVLLPIKVGITADGGLWTGSPPVSISPQEMVDMIVASDPAQLVELTADEAVSARLVIRINKIIQETGRQAVMIVQAQ